MCGYHNLGFSSVKSPVIVVVEGEEEAEAEAVDTGTVSLYRSVVFSFSLWPRFCGLYNATRTVASGGTDSSVIVYFTSAEVKSSDKV